MGWATLYIEKLQSGQQASFRPSGHSMKGKIESGELVTVYPLKMDPEVGNIVLCKVKGREYLHLVKAIKGSDDAKRFLIGNNRGGTNGWTGRNKIYGIYVRNVQDEEKSHIIQE